MASFTKAVRTYSLTNQKDIDHVLNYVTKNPLWFFSIKFQIMEIGGPGSDPQPMFGEYLGCNIEKILSLKQFKNIWEDDGVHKEIFEHGYNVFVYIFDDDIEFWFKISFGNDVHNKKGK